MTEINETLTAAPETINTAANTTWLIRIELTDALESESLMQAAAYEKFIAEETGH